MDERRQFADGLYARGMYASAAKEYLALLQEFPDAVEADAVRFRMGESYLNTGDRPAAAEQFNIVVANYPNSAVLGRRKVTYRATACSERSVVSQSS